MLLRNRDKDRLLSIFATLDVPAEVWAYGSRVTGNAHEGSDLDLVIRTHDLQRLPYSVLQGLRKRIRESNITILVDIFDWAQLPDAFRKNIEACHAVLFTNMGNAVQEPPAPYNRKGDASEH